MLQVNTQNYALRNQLKSKVSFRSSDKNVESKAKYEKGPVKSGFEYIDAIKAALVGSIGLTLYFLAEGGAELLDWGAEELSRSKNTKDFLSPNQMKEIALKQRNKHLRLAVGGLVGITSVIFLAVLPKHLYNKKKEIFVKKKEADVYIRNNAAEKTLYEKIDSKAKVANTKQARELSGLYMKLKAGKNELPEFMKEKPLIQRKQGLSAYMPKN